MYIRPLNNIHSHCLMSGAFSHENFGAPQDDFIMMDPTERLRLYAVGGGASGGASEVVQLPTAEELTSAIFAGGGVPPKASMLAKVAQSRGLLKPMEGGAIYAWTRKSSSKLSHLHAVLTIPKPMMDIAAVLFAVNQTHTWMARLEHFKVIKILVKYPNKDPEEVEVESLEELFEIFKRNKDVTISMYALGRFKAGDPVFEGRFLWNFRHLDEGIQVTWQLDGDQESDSPDAKMMGVNNCSFTLVPSPSNPLHTIIAYYLQVTPHPKHLNFMTSYLITWVPNSNMKELPILVQGLENRTRNQHFTAKNSLDPLGIKLMPVRYHIEYVK